MSDDYWNDDDDQDTGNTSGRGLRAQLEKALADKKAAESERDQLRTRVAEQSVVGFLQDKVQNPPAVARLASRDGVDLGDEKALEKWLTDNGDLFAKPVSNAAPDGDSSPPEPDPAPPEGAVDTFGAMSRIHAAASAATVNRHQAVLSALPEDATPEMVRQAHIAAGL